MAGWVELCLSSPSPKHQKGEDHSSTLCPTLFRSMQTPSSLLTHSSPRTFVDGESLLTVQEVSAADTFGKTFKGHIPASNPCGLKKMDVAIKVSHNRTPQTCDQELETMFKDFAPIIVDLKHCVEEGRMHTDDSGTLGYYSSKKGGAASKNDDVLAVGILALSTCGQGS